MKNKLAISALLCFGLLNAAPEDSAKKSRVQTIKTIEEYKKIAAQHGPTVIVVGTDTCEACTLMNPCTEKTAQANPNVSFYCIDGKSSTFKPLVKELKIKAYPTTFFIRKNRPTNRQQGGLSQVEVDQYVKQLIEPEKKATIAIKK